MDKAVHKDALTRAIAAGRVSDIRSLQAYAWSRGWSLRAMAPRADRIMPRVSIRGVRGAHFQVAVSFALDGLAAHPPGTWTFALLARGRGATACHIGQTQGLLRHLSKTPGPAGAAWDDAHGVCPDVVLLEYRLPSAAEADTARALAQVKSAWVTAARRAGLEVPGRSGDARTRMMRHWDDAKITERQRPLAAILAEAPPVARYCLNVPDRWTGAATAQADATVIDADDPVPLH